MLIDSKKPYNPKETEPEIYKLWEKSGYFNPDNLPRPPRLQTPGVHKNKLKVKSFCIIMPPPNANAPLHLGHAVFVALQDIMTRYHRMKGEKTLWLPGADHAGFETQVVFDKKLEKEGRNRFKIPREKLYEEMLEFTLKNKKIMEGQLKKLGASCDWSREKFTLDKDIIEIVYQTFEKLYRDGLVYRGERIINWCAKHQTALSELETKYIEQKDPLYYIKYGPLTLATVRPETKFGDTAVAVNPKDKRYQKYIGKEIEIETLLGKIKMKVIADEMVALDFGTGVVKITPAHDPNDFEMGKKHNLEIKEVIDQYGRLNEKTGPYQGLKVMEARKKVAEALEKNGLLEKIDENYTHTIATCYKCGSTLEPRIMKQWFVKIKPLAELAEKAVKKGEVKFITKKYEKIFFHWMKNIRDWNISRQIVWGIRIPAWYKKPKTWNLKIYGKDIFDAIVKGTKTIETRAGRPKTENEKYWGDFKPGDIIEFSLADEKTDAIIESEPLIKKSVKKINHFKTIEEMLKVYKPEQDYPGKSATQIIEWWRKKPVLMERIKKYGIWAIELNQNIETNEEVYIGIKPPQGEEWTRDTDVFDTWFSSGQWPFATLLASRGNPKSEIRNPKKKLKLTSKDFEDFYPTSVMETGWDILFFWVARMIMLGIYATGKPPFQYVYLHGLVRDKDRQKMSKSRGNVIDPLGVVELYGADALRMALIVGNTPGNDIIISEEKIRGYQKFANKIWNASRFVVKQTGNSKSEARNSKQIQNSKFKIQNLTDKDKKILKELNNLVKEITKLMDEFKFYAAAEKIYHYFWHIFADKIIEEAKPRIDGKNKKDKQAAQYVLREILETNLKLLHPFMPFITEKIWQELAHKNLLLVEKWPR